MISREALQYLINIGEDTQKITKVHGLPYSHMPLKKVPLPEVEALKLHTLESLVTFIKTEKFEPEELPLTVHIESYDTIKVYGPVREDRGRELHIIVTAPTPKEISYGQFYDLEQFNIALQSRFVKNDDRDILLRFTGLVKEEKVRETGDDGIAQAVTIKTGVTTVANAVVPNPVNLAPYRTFSEIEQPESQFVFRMKDGPAAALFEADGGAWKLKAIKSIKEYLEAGLNEITILA